MTGLLGEVLVMWMSNAPPREWVARELSGASPCSFSMPANKTANYTLLAGALFKNNPHKCAVMVQHLVQSHGLLGAQKVDLQRRSQYFV